MASMEIVRFGPDDADRLSQYVEVTNAARATDSPWSHPATVKGFEGRFRYGWDGEVETPFVGLIDGVPVATGTVATSEYDNLHIAWLGLTVHPDQRRRGYGTTMLEHLVAETKAQGRTSIGTDGWDSAALRGFAARHGLTEGSVAVQRRQVLADLDWPEIERLHAESTAAASAYELIRREGRTPDDELDAMTAMTAAINDAPTDDLDIEDEVFTPERVRGYEEAQLARGDRLFRVFARHRESGELAGHSVVVVDGERPHLGAQHDTSVVGTHRGHRLGMLLKTDMNLWLRDVQPQLTEISTWNAESNDFMIGVNEAIGYRILGRELELQKVL
ncbi:MAG TPA: GNAT family N-acetyltransferase [Nocardioides sp.]|uniref:GNAT family N-acetyltransferase n=1 Tax=uncultured Nocardioides sp. TaxID=198441 RepID=UPI000EE7D5C1|nr:GNAT family N-acetyltransferase [uncultured Nocardioides sp.]HCB03715.1 GNAT family N-acetyltransferase [Nocardioides sp.]HRD59790.1 GNAT family N-acetyltransferase [Nocardioides sp.]HRI95270.1 GNAT family N-acetyltransferase [Nocardioides sp.]HRK44899.1 GNAT family N-acetyltransferase [Nocardioides sp.]